MPAWKLGLICGAAMLGVLLAGLLLWWWLSKRSQQRPQSETPEMYASMDELGHSLIGDPEPAAQPAPGSSSAWRPTTNLGRH